MEYATIKELVSLAEAAETSIWKIVLQVEAEEEEITEEEVKKSMLANLEVMKEINIFFEEIISKLPQDI